MSAKQNKPGQKSKIRIPLSPYAVPELILLPILSLAIALVAGLVLPDLAPWVQLVVFALLVFPLLGFFRDPQRHIPADPNVLLAPADGKVTDVTSVTENEFLTGKALRIGIFMGLLDAHINRAPCAGRVGYIKAHHGKFFNAMRWRWASEHNQSNCVGLHCPDHPAGNVMVKQISGLLARRIVCRCRMDDQLSAGQRFGMVKFGSRAELFLPLNERAKVLIGPGDKVKAGKTILVRYT